MTSKYQKIAIALGACFAVGVLFSSARAQYYNRPDIDRPLISVNGEAEVRVTPDIAIIILEIETIDKALTDSKGKNDDLIKKIEKLTVKYEIDKSNFQVDRFTFDPRYEREKDKSTFIGYAVSRTVAITLSDVSKFEDLMTDLISEGADNLRNVEFRTSELRKYRDQARSMAIKAAKEKADAMAAELGQNVGKPFNITEYGSSMYSWYGRSSDRGGPFNTQISIDSQPAYDGDEPIGLGKISITAKVGVSFELE